MPMLLSTPERWFRTRQCDFYEFRPAHGPDDRSVDLPTELTDWLAANFPDRELQSLGPRQWASWIGIQWHAFHVSLRCGEVAITRKRMSLSDALCRAVTDIRVHDAQQS